MGDMISGERGLGANRPETQRRKAGESDPKLRERIAEQVIPVAMVT